MRKTRLCCRVTLLSFTLLMSMSSTHRNSAPSCGQNKGVASHRAAVLSRSIERIVCRQSNATNEPYRRRWFTSRFYYFIYNAVCFFLPCSSQPQTENLSIFLVVFRQSYSTGIRPMAQPWGAGTEGAQTPPLAIRILMFIFIV